MGEMMSSAEEFFGLPTEEKTVHYSTDSKKLPRVALEAYTTAVRAVALRLLRLTAAGLGLDEGHFKGELSAGPVIMNMEVVRNGALRGGEHRVVTNARAARTSQATFVMPARWAPPGMVPDGDAPQYRPFTYQARRSWARTLRRPATGTMPSWHVSRTKD
ncbi:hypothetical protein C2845_PM11G08700 [Panicum miliaceum]|uniref:Uncharacterized protein n=1 Tax=Panicum miliaceum TaxID=4540 RepID=A0A3L6RPT9_PANMI|nr:hypothetical protein C2845_PM11G08700 [Panicum miliaceum]